jgi:CRISPR/Cas system-associated endonuclease Cas1
MVGAPAAFDHAGLRRAHALAPYVQTTRGHSVAAAVTRWLLDQRLPDQARIAETMLGREDQAEAIHALRRALTAAHTVDDLLVVEGQAADRYWSCWQPVELRFASADRARVPGHWRRFTGRRSPLSANAWTNRHAATPGTALINYGMRLAEVESSIACLALELDPAMGLAHAVRQGRPSASLDLMEAVRGVVEEAVLTLIRDRTLRVLVRRPRYPTRALGAGGPVVPKRSRRTTFSCPRSCGLR